MLLTFDLKKKVAPIHDSVHESKSSDQLVTLKKTLNELILMAEGFCNHVPDLNEKEAKTFLADTRFSIDKMLSLKTTLLKGDYWDDEVKKLFNYALNTLYRLESLLHVKSTQSAEIEKTEDHIKSGLAQFSKEAIDR